MEVSYKKAVGASPERARAVYDQKTRCLAPLYRCPPTALGRPGVVGCYSTIGVVNSRLSHKSIDGHEGTEQGYTGADHPFRGVKAFVHVFKAFVRVVYEISKALVHGFKAEDHFPIHEI